MRVKFLRTVQYESEGRNKGPIYKEGEIHDFKDRDDLGHRWIRRGVAEDVSSQVTLKSAAKDDDEEGDGKQARQPAPSAARGR